MQADFSSPAMPLNMAGPQPFLLLVACFSLFAALALETALPLGVVIAAAGLVNSVGFRLLIRG